ncbi:MAG: hypothetical protein JSS49_11655 [Planctomycetes bacterium]|nr:hypothetical protein [Planctomycetota bacterium]
MKSRQPAQARTVRYSSSLKLFGWPLVSIAFGPEVGSNSGQTIGCARGIIAIGDIAIGGIAIGGIAGGGIAIGGVSCGGLALGGVALGGLILGGVAVGAVASGGVAIGHYARGGAVVGNHVISPQRTDPEAVRLFNRLTPGSLPRP